MTDNTVAGLCRLTVHAPEKLIDLAVPADIPVVDLLPTLVEYAGENLAERGLEHGGWLLQRLDGERLDEESSLDSLGLRDGDTVYLRPRTDALPEVQLDDLVDGISTTMQDRPYGWTPQIARRLLLAFAAAASAAAFVVLAIPGLSADIRALGAAATALLLLAGAGSASRAVGDAGAGAALGLPAVCCLALTGWLVPGGALTGPHAHEVLGSRLLASGAAAAGGALLAVAIVASFAALFVAAAVIASACALAGALILAAELVPAHAAGLIALLAVIFGAFVPSLSFRLAGLRMPPLPTNAQQLQEGIEPHSPSAVAARAVVADGWMTGLYGATGAVCAAALLGLATEPGLAEILMIGVLSTLLLLHSRGLGNTLQRLALLGPAAAGAALLVYCAVVTFSPTGRLLLAAALLSVTAALAIAAWTVPGRRLVPYWGRAAELLHSATAIAMLPMALWVLGVYGYLRGLNG
ncbi:type VII secretion integral membrane protein EccD [Streptomyces sp. NBC_00879]|uniref:type VII secretion integral membrane protein EccD n=1 Tax=Streptomyces sp. NBC_00879 TaxID=2975855 RepID=UPI00386FD547|nr:type VII secretion integral membrane protein EccD [Streptomyces sp. NBC_00879]